jgi:translocation and assembly module TamB
VRVRGTLEPFGPYRRMDLELEGERLLLARDARLLARADARLALSGTPSQLRIRGELALAEGRYRGEISPLEELLNARRRSEPMELGTFTLWPDGPLANAELDVHLGGRAFEYRTNLLEAELRPDLHLGGTGAQPVLEGPAYVERASLELPSGKLRLDSGLLTFRRASGLAADVAFSANLRVQRHEVRLVASGTLDALEFTASSTPPLAGDDLWVLILTGQLPTARWQDRNSQAMEALAVFLARDSLVRWLDRGGDGEGLLERFEIDVGAKTSRSGQPTGRVLFYLKPESRRSGRATYLSAELDEYDRVNYALGIVFRPR